MEKENEIKNKIVQTYAEDMAKVIGEDRGGLIKKIIHGEEENEREKMNLSPETRKNKIYMVLSVFLVMMGIATLIFFFLQREGPPVVMEKQFVPLIFIDQKATFEIKDLNKDQILQTVLNEINTSKVKNGGVEGIYLTYDKKIIGLRKFIALIESNFIPGNALFVDENFLMGMVNNRAKVETPATSFGGRDFFILIKMRSIADIFNGLRSWENKMFTDLQGFLGIELSPDTNYLLTKNFEDGVVKNKNARILYNQNGEVVLMYVFAEENSVIITNTQNSAEEIMLRLAASQVKE